MNKVMRRAAAFFLACSLACTGPAGVMDVQAGAAAQQDAKLAKKLTLFAKEQYAAPVKGGAASKLKNAKWQSSDASVATVTKKGMIRAKKPGKAAITVSFTSGKKTKTSSLQLTVKKAGKNPKITLKKKSANLPVGGTYKIKVKKAKGLSTKKAVYKSSDKSIASVSRSGKVTAKKAGKAVVTVTSAVNRKAKAKFAVRVYGGSGSSDEDPDPQPEKHEYGQFVTDVEPGCESEGERSRHCLFHPNDNNDRMDVEKIPASGHAYADGKCVYCGKESGSARKTISNLVDGGKYPAGTCLAAPDGCRIFVNGEEALLSNGEHEFSEPGEFTVKSVGFDGGETEIHITILAAGESGSAGAGGFVNGGIYAPGQEASSEEGGKLIINGQEIKKEDQPFRFEADGNYHVEFVDKDGNRDVADITIRHPHDYSILMEEIPASCEEDGRKVTACAVCGKELVRASQALGHSYGSWEMETAASCKKDGTQKRVCAVCGKEERQALEKLGHEWGERTVDAEPTCTQSGASSIHCKRCNEVKDEEEIPAKGHSFGEWETIKSPSCAEDGVKQRTCADCSYVEAEETPANGHTWDADMTVDKEPSCTEDGSSSIHCMECDAVKDSEIIPAAGHSYGGWETTEDASCTEEGLKERVCSICEEVDAAAVPAKGHEFADEFTVDLEPTCVEAGSRSKHCTRCDAKDGLEEIPAKGHSYEDSIAREPSCTEDGERLFECGNCNASYTEAVAKLGHAYEGNECSRCHDRIHEDVKETSGLVDGGVYNTGLTIDAPEGGQVMVNGSLAETEDGQVSFREPGVYEVTVTDKEGNETTVTITVTEGAESTFDALADGGRYPLGQIVSIPAGGRLIVDDVEIRPEDLPYSFAEEGRHTVVYIDADGNQYKKTIEICHMHMYEAEVEENATCTEDGSMRHSCGVCEKSYLTVIPAAGHSYGEWETVSSPNCTDKGSDRRICSVCGNVETRDVDANGHDWNESYETDREADCLNAGLESIHCRNCDVVKDAREIAALGHSYGEWRVTLEPTCTGAGRKIRECSRCSHMDEAAVAANGHSWNTEFTTDREPTCTESGEKSIYCSACSEKKDTTSIPALGHSYGNWTTTRAATCTANGERQKTCSRCSRTETETIAALGHSYSASFTTDVAATCTTAGSKSKHCSRCTAKSDVTSIPALGHSYGDWTTVSSPNCTDKGSEKRTCSVCGNVETRDLNANGHSWNTAYTTDREATCTAAGSKSIHCKNCSATKDSTTIAALGHSYGSYTTTTAATCTAAGSKYRTCSRCNNRDTASIAALGHSYSTSYTTDVAATCTTAGSKSKHCSRCTAKTNITSIAALGHSYGSYTTATAATCTATGSKYRTCSRCSNRDTASIPALGHSYSNGECTRCSAKSPSYAFISLLHSESRLDYVGAVPSASGVTEFRDLKSTSPTQTNIINTYSDSGMRIQYSLPSGNWNVTVHYAGYSMGPARLSGSGTYDFGTPQNTYMANTYISIVKAPVYPYGTSDANSVYISSLPSNVYIESFVKSGDVYTIKGAFKGSSCTFEHGSAASNGSYAVRSLKINNATVSTSNVSYSVQSATTFRATLTGGTSGDNRFELVVRCN